MSTTYPIILLHGAVSSEVSLNNIRRHLADHRKVYSFNFTGHGGKDNSPEGFGIEPFSNELMAFMDMKKLDKASVFGYSMGGYVALYAALQNPERFNAVLTLGTRLIWTPEIANGEIAKLDPKKIMEKVPAFAAQLKHEHSEPKWEALLSNTADMLRQLGDEPLLTKANLSTLKVPVRICISEHDTMADPGQSKEIAALIPGSDFYQIPDASHPIEKTPLQEILQQIRSFL